MLLYSKTDIADRVGELARDISRDYSDKELVVIGILKGAFVFLADLVRSLTVPVTIDFLGLSSYGLGSQSSRRMTVTKDFQIPIRGKHVLVVEDILDSGLSVEFALKMIREREPASLRLCALVDKRELRIVPVAADYVGFGLDRGFVVGYGMDYAECYRHMPEIYRLDFE